MALRFLVMQPLTAIRVGISEGKRMCVNASPSCPRWSHTARDFMHTTLVVCLLQLLLLLLLLLEMHFCSSVDTSFSMTGRRRHFQKKKTNKTQEKTAQKII